MAYRKLSHPVWRQVAGALPYPDLTQLRVKHISRDMLVLLALKDHPDMPRPFLVIDIRQRDGRIPMGVAPVWCATLAEAHHHWCGRTGER